MSQETVLVVDDVELNREMLKVVLEDYYNVLLAEDGEEAVNMILNKENHIDAVLLDFVMPKKDGYKVLQELAEKDILTHLPVLMISAEDDPDNETRCLHIGASDFIHKPFVRDIVLMRVRNTIALFKNKNSLEEQVAEQTIELKQKNQELEEMNEKIIGVLAEMVEFRDVESGKHVERVKTFTNIIAKEMAKEYPELHLDDHKIEVITSAAAMHDIGKIAISDTILLKPGKLTNEEYEEMKTHTTKGANLVKNIQGIWDDEYAQVVHDIALYHHERDDGKGYPEGLKGDEIPLSAQLVSIADVYDALVNKRVYKDAFDQDEAVNMIMNGECGVFNKKLLSSFYHCKDELAKKAVELRD